MTLKVQLVSAFFLVTATAAFRAGPNTASRSVSETNADSIAVAKVVDNFHDALSKGDSAMALRLLASDAVILESGGIEQRSEYRAHHLPDDIEFARAIASTRRTLGVRVNGMTAWTFASSTVKGTFKGKPIDSTGAESMVLTKDAGGWRIRSIHWSSRKRAPLS